MENLSNACLVVVGNLVVVEVVVLNVVAAGELTHVPLAQIKSFGKYLKIKDDGSASVLAQSPNIAESHEISFIKECPNVRL